MIEYGVYHVAVDGWGEVKVHDSLESAELDYSTCGWNCAIVERRYLEDAWRLHNAVV